MLIQPLQNDVEYSADHAGGKFYIRTNLQAPNYRLVEMADTKTGAENWKDVIPHREKVFFRGFELFKDHSAIEDESEGLYPKIRLIKWSDKTETAIDFGEPVHIAGIDNNPEFDSKVIRYSYQSMTTPPSTYDYAIDTKEKIIEAT